MLRFYLVPTNTTLGLLRDSSPKRRDRSFSFEGVIIDDTHWSSWKRVLVRALAVHPWRVFHQSEAQVSIVPSPASGACEHWDSLHGQRQSLIVIDLVDADFVGSMGLRCPALWHTSTCTTSPPNVLRVVGSPPVHGKRKAPMARCPHVSVPWPTHARSSTLAQRLERPRPIHIAYAAGVDGHSMAHALGYDIWRRSLRAACRELNARDRSHCQYVPQSIAGGLSHRAVMLYAKSRFCLTPPGDTIPRQGIVDAITVGCVPVFFHRQQQDLWPWHWVATNASILYDWGDSLASSAPTNATAQLDRLVHYPAQKVRDLQRELARVAPSFIYHTAMRVAPEALQANADSLAVPLSGGAVEAFLVGVRQRVTSGSAAPG